MPGPAPKHHSQRRRANASAGVTTLPAAGRSGKRPALPLKGASKEAREWWATAWASPMAAVWLAADVPGLVWLAADVPGLVRLATLVDRAAKEGESTPMTVLTEIRALEDRYGLSPLARRRLEWELETAASDSAIRGGATAGGDERWRRVASD